MIDRDEEATDPLVDAQELLPRMKWLSCRIPPLRRRCRKAIKMVKSVGEGDWGGKDDLEKPDVRTHPSYTDWLLDFVGAGPPIVSSGSDNDNTTRWEHPDQGPQPGPSTRPTSARDLPAGLRAEEGEVLPRTPPEPDISRVRGSAASVSAQPPTEPDLQIRPLSEKSRDTNLNYCTKDTTCSNLTASSRMTMYQSTSPSERLGVREGETSIQSDQVSDMGEITVGIQFSQQQGSG